MKRIIISLIFFSYILVGCSQTEKVKIQKEMKVLEDVEAQIEIDVSLDLTIVEEQGKIQIEGETNLPNGMELMITLSNNNGYTAQDKQTVRDGLVKSGTYTDKGSHLQNGKYSVEIITPTAIVQPEEVRKVIGDNGINLVGTLIKHDEVWGNQLIFQKSFTFGVKTSESDSNTSPSTSQQEGSPSKEEVYQYMMSAFEEVTDNEENYLPEIHDPMVIKMAAQRFGISESEADRIFLEMAMQ